MFKKLILTTALVINTVGVFASGPSNSPLDATQPYHPFDPSGSKTDSASRTQREDPQPYKIPDAAPAVQPPSTPTPPPAVPPRRIDK